MTSQTRATLKTYFQTGDKPSASNFGDTIDSFVSLVDTTAQAITSNVSALGTWQFKSDVTVSGKSTLTGAVSAKSSLNVNGLSTMGNLISSSIKFNPTTNGITGTTTNDNASTGYVGEYISSTVLVGSAVAMTSTIIANITSISLTAGDWDVWGSIATNVTGSTTTSQVTGWTSTTSSAFPINPNGGGIINLITPISAGQSINLPIGMMRLSLASTTTVYLSAFIVFANSTLSTYGFIGSRRVR